MVLYGYGNNPNEQDRLEAESFIKAWANEQKRVAKTISGFMRAKLKQIYANTPHERLSTPPSQFVDNIAWRVYTEACMNGEVPESADYNGEALIKFVEIENMLASQRTSKGLFHQPSLSPDELLTRTLEGVTRRAVELFSDWNGHTEPPYREEKKDGCIIRIYDNKRNLRADLRSYIGF